ncbi:TetR/AcrR family transcriptional regulator [Rhizobium sp. SSA_523]|uniref:TetR/AcrR family transcriptional regulator n=1 Tax=Rhizobium sp. SSA_523 TaxID=2952477 RepID=UPI0020916DF5|nr:TetR/AcrR family transcriptional regulator [Rhizobium sp. SSA_523]MCO5731804.1 TetR/AcrR family transcriptional regulator [Rhizobium sp. SSA_523]WKC22830.1 TetR/AcrR family transcriptional regulator [Rhizobium sp. SSA_523]
MLENKCPRSGAALAAGRFAAGEDPAKREQILDGAKRVFMRLGFDAASMNDITREAGVSKGTIYVYFQNKDDLFAAIMERERTRLAESMRDILDGSEEVEDGLYRFGVAFAERVTSHETISAMRTMISVAPRMPILSQRFFQDDSMNIRFFLERFLIRQIARGVLRMDDVSQAARHFLELSTGTFMKMRLFGHMAQPPSRAEIEKQINSAVRLFMAGYGASPDHARPA